MGIGVMGNNSDNSGTQVHWRWRLFSQVGRGPPTFWLLWAAPISGPHTFLGDVNFFFLYIAIMTGENLQ